LKPIRQYLNRGRREKNDFPTAPVCHLAWNISAIGGMKVHAGQIGEVVGYASLKTFRRAFQKETGLMPAGYRASLL
jgi:AraC-like DNA-binding protein